MAALQAVSLQVLSVLFFYLISVYLSKDDFGVVSWANAVGVMIVSVLGMGLEQVVVRRIAASGAAHNSWPAAAFLAHALLGTLISAMALFGLKALWITAPDKLQWVPVFFLVQGLMYLGLPFRQWLNAGEKFAPYAIISFVCNAGRLAAAWWWIRHGDLTVRAVWLILLVAAAAELVGLLVAAGAFRFRYSFRKSTYLKLLHEARLQYISVLFDAALSRVDWVLLGILGTNAAMGNYSFAYRAFEIGRLPMLMLAPVLLSRFSRLRWSYTLSDQQHLQSLRALLKIEALIGSSTAAAAIVFWAPAMDAITRGKYGTENADVFSILACCIPLQLFINLYWTLGFAGKKYRPLSRIAIICAALNLSLNLALIPWLGATGAAVAFLVATLLQLALYYILGKKQGLQLDSRSSIVLVMASCCTAVLLRSSGMSLALQLCTLMAVLIFTAAVSGHLKICNAGALKRLLRL